MVMHSALQQMVNDACRQAGKATYTLNQQPGYEMVYKDYCSRRSVSALVAAAPVHVSFTRDDYMRGCLRCWLQQTSWIAALSA